MLVGGEIRRIGAHDVSRCCQSSCAYVKTDQSTRRAADERPAGQSPQCRLVLPQALSFQPNWRQQNCDRSRGHISQNRCSQATNGGPRGLGHTLHGALEKPRMDASYVGCRRVPEAHHCPRRRIFSKDSFQNQGDPPYSPESLPHFIRLILRILTSFRRCPYTT